MVTILTPLSLKRNNIIAYAAEVLGFIFYKGSIGHAFTVCIPTLNENQQNQMELLPFYSTQDFCSCRAHLRTPVLLFNRCAAPAKLPS